MTYTIKKAESLTYDLGLFLAEEVPKLSRLYGSKFNYFNCDIDKLIDKGYFYYCERDGEITGIHVSYLGSSPFDPERKILRQLLFYVKPNSGRTAYHLFKNFIDIGKQNANHIITMLTSHTNIKPETLHKFGFGELETLYRMEVESE